MADRMRVTSLIGGPSRVSIPPAAAQSRGVARVPIPCGPATIDHSPEGVSSMLALRVVVGCLIVLAFASRVLASPEVTKEARQFVADHEKRLKPLDVASSLAWWEASTTGSKEAFAKKRSEEHTSELQSLRHIVCRLLLE